MQIKNWQRIFLVDRAKKLANPSNGKVLDIGYGDGNPYLNNVVGIEIRKTKKPENYDKVFVMDAQHMKFKNKSFDTITVGCVLAHVENPSLFLRECHRVLKDNGRLIITIPNPMSPPTLISNVFFPTHPATASQHISVIPPRNLVLLFAHNGFNIERRVSLGIQFPIGGGFRIKSPLSISQEIIYVLKKTKSKKDKVLKIND